VEGGVVEDDDLTLLQVGEQLMLKPGLDLSRIAGALKGQRRQKVSLAQRRHHRDAPRLVSPAVSETWCSLAAPAPRVDEGIIHAALVHIHPSLLGHTRHLL
jgi:hypothetical protein